jgi:predicted MFS family arabinose efflux permease
MIARHVPRDRADHQQVSIRSELTALRSGRLWLTLAACGTMTGGVLAAYSFISPLLTDETGISANLIPLVLVGFEIGSLVGSIVGGRLGDAHPHATTIIAPVGTTVMLLAISLLASAPLATTVLIVLLGLGANPVLIALAVRYADHAPTLGSSLAVAAFNVGTAAASWIGGIALESSLGAVGPVAIGSVIAALTLIPTIALAVAQRRRSTALTVAGIASPAAACPATA